MSEKEKLWVEFRVEKQSQRGLRSLVGTYKDGFAENVPIIISDLTINNIEKLKAKSKDMKGAFVCQGLEQGKAEAFRNLKGSMDLVIIACNSIRHHINNGNDFEAKDDLEAIVIEAQGWINEIAKQEMSENEKKKKKL